MNDYPTKEELLEIRKWGNIKDPATLFEFIHSIWWMPDWGWKQTKYRGKTKIYCSTGGWSGNEDIISALRNSIAYSLYWQQARRGGHYIFEFPSKQDK